jgi:hypothetical protein
LFRKINDQVARDMQEHLDTAPGATTLTIAVNARCGQPSPANLLFLQHGRGANRDGT